MYPLLKQYLVQFQKAFNTAVLKLAETCKNHGIGLDNSALKTKVLLTQVLVEISCAP